MCIWQSAMTKDSGKNRMEKFTKRSYDGGIVRVLMLENPHTHTNKCICVIV